VFASSADGNFVSSSGRVVRIRIRR
jgi:hypothetical protein